MDKGSEFYNAFLKKWLKDNDIEMYSMHNDGKFIVAERFIRNLTLIRLEKNLSDFNINLCNY